MTVELKCATAVYIVKDEGRTKVATAICLQTTVGLGSEGGLVVGGQREAALQELHDRHASELWRFAMRLTHDRQLSEDVVQEVLLKAWKDPSLGQRDDARLAWLFTASRNLIIDRWRSAASRHEQRMEEPPEESSGDATSVVLDRWLIAEALGSLSLEHRSVINAAYYEGRSVAASPPDSGSPKAPSNRGCTTDSERSGWLYRRKE
jgi:RNA polymerase sigma-70 factor (ECF subfamily)